MKGRVLVFPWHRSKGGIWLQGDPHVYYDATPDCAVLGAAVEEALALSRADVAQPRTQDAWAAFQAEVRVALAQAGVDVEEYDERSIHCDVAKREREITVTPIHARTEQYITGRAAFVAVEDTAALGKAVFEALAIAQATDGGTTDA